MPFSRSEITSRLIFQINPFVCERCSRLNTEGYIDRITNHKYCQKCANEVYGITCHLSCEICSKFEDLNLMQVSINHAPKIICTKCYETLFFQCGSCMDAVLKQNQPKIDSDYNFCSDCVTKRKVLECYACKEYFLKHRGLIYGDKFYCRKDQDLFFIECAYCGEQNFKEEVVDCGVCERSYSENCYFKHIEEDNCHPPQIFNQTGQPFIEGKSTKLVSNLRYVGVEIEVERTNLSSHISSSVLKSSEFSLQIDGSLKNGLEVVTAPASGGEIERLVKKACKALTDTKYTILPTCGLHVHIDMRDKQENFEYLAHLFTTFYAIEDILFAMQPKSRQRNHYCKRLRSNYKFYDFYGTDYIEEFDHKYYKMPKTPYNIKEIASEKQKHYANSRYFGVNFHSVFRNGTLEIRMHAGSLNAVKILRWIHILLAIVKWVDEKHDYKTALKLLDLPVDEEKLKLFKKTFKLDKTTMNYIKGRIQQFDNWGLNLPKKMGKENKNPPKKTPVKKTPHSNPGSYRLGDMVASFSSTFIPQNLDDWGMTPELLTTPIQPSTSVEVVDDYYGIDMNALREAVRAGRRD